MKKFLPEIIFLLLLIITLFVCFNYPIHGQGGSFYYDGEDSVYDGGKWHYNSKHYPEFEDCQSCHIPMKQYTELKDSCGSGSGIITVSENFPITLEVEWLGSPVGFIQTQINDSLWDFIEFRKIDTEIGLREDGVVVWRKLTNEVNR